MTETIFSPCVSRCLLDQDDICVGCHRSLAEIKVWMELDDAGKRDVLEQCRQRAAVAQKGSRK